MKKNKILLMTAMIMAVEGLTFTSANAYQSSKYDMTVAPFVGDFNGDGKSDFGVKTAGGDIHIANTKANGTIGLWTTHLSGYGGTDAYPLIGDFDGDKKSDIAVRTRDGEIFVDYAKNGLGKWDYHATGYGTSGDVPLIGDFNGDGRDDLLIRNPNGDIHLAYTDADGIGRWDYHASGYGTENDYPFIGDFNGDGKDDLGIRSTNGDLHIAYTDANNGIGRWDYHAESYGTGTGYALFVGDFNGDGKDDFGLKADNGHLWLAHTDADNGIGRWDYYNDGYGGSDAYPIVGDFNGDGKDDFGVKNAAGEVWLAFTDADGTIGKYDYRNSGYGINEVPGTVHKSQEEINREAVVNKAKQYLGVPYVWGGTSPSGFDCSGLVQYVYKNAVGINLARTTYDQVNNGRAVSANELLPGDLIFPHSGHVQIYIGGGQVLHAPQTGDVVKIAPLGKVWKARRIIG